MRKFFHPQYYLAMILPALLLVVMLLNSPASACEQPNRDVAIAQVLSDNPGGKILKVEQITEAGGCALHIRVLIDGTVKLVVVQG